MKYFRKRGYQMYRKAIEVLEAWKRKENKRALLVTGARQIGKTYIIREFGRSNYKHFAEINFITTPSAENIFAGDLDANTVIMNLTAFLGQPLEKGKTLVFLDEIQECPRARTAIKFLVDDGRFDYIESGSLLGVNYKNVPSYPVGYEEVLQMYPMDFEEFCIACGIQTETLNYLKECYDNLKPVSDSIHNTFLKLFRYYTLVGGMPDVVQLFVNTNDIAQVTARQKDIVLQYRQDISQYAISQKTKITNIFDNIPAQLDDKNRRFKLSSISSNARLRDYEDAFLWLKDAGVGLPCYNLSAPVIPLKVNEQSRLFKLFLNDSGLLCSMCMENVQFEILQGNMSINMGSILENTFATQFTSNGFALRYMNKNNVGEIDFVIQQSDHVMLVEIKSGKDYKSHAALTNFLKTKKWKLNKGLVFCSGNIEQKENVLYLPWYMISFVKPIGLASQTVSLDFS